MSLKEAMRAGESGGRKAAVREELLPSQHPLPKPTRDVSASNRSHSLTHDEPPLFPSQRRIIILDREAEEGELEKQANMVYTRQFRMLAKLLGNESMEFEELREKVEGLVLADRPAHDPILLQRIQTLEWELSRRANEARSSQSLPASQQYLRGLETELGRKNKMITELSDSVKREAFEEAVRGLQAEIEAKTAELQAVQEQAQEARMRTNASLSLLEEELVRHKQTIQKLTFQLDSQKRRAQNASQDVERLRRREKELTTSLQSEGKATYQGLTYSSHALLLQLQARDQQLSTSISEQHTLQQELNSLRRLQLQSEEQIKQTQQEWRALQSKLQYEESQKQRLLEQIEQVTRQLRSSKQAVSSVNANHQALLMEKQAAEQALRETIEQVRHAQAELKQMRQDCEGYTHKIAQDQQIITNLTIHLEQTRRELSISNESLNQLHDRNQSLQQQLSEWTRALHDNQQHFQQKEQQIDELRREITHRGEEFSLELAHKQAEYRQRIGTLQISLANQEEISRESAARYASLSAQATHLEGQIHNLTQQITHKSTLIKQKEENEVILEQRIQAFEQEKYLLMHRIEEFERQCAELAERERHWEDIARGRPALQAEINTRQMQEQHLRVMLEEAAGKEAQLEAELEQKTQHLKDIIEDRKKQQTQFEQQLGKLTRFVEELQEQQEQEKHGQQARMEEEYRIRDQLEHEVHTLRLTITELENKHAAGNRAHAELENRNQQIQRQLTSKYEEEHLHNQHLLQENDELRSSHQQLTATLNQQNHKLMESGARQNQLQAHFQIQIERLQHEIAELKLIIEELKTDKGQLQRQLQMQRKPKDNELGSFTFEHFQGEHQQQQQSPADLQAIIRTLQQQLEASHREREEEQRIRLSYSNTLEGSMSPALIGSLQSQREYLQNENKRLQQDLINHKNEFIEKEHELVEICNELQAVRARLQEHQQLLEQQDDQIAHLSTQLSQQKDSAHASQQESKHFQEIFRQKEDEYVLLRQRYNEEMQKINLQEAELMAIRAELQRIRDAKEVQTVTEELEKTKGELTLAIAEITKLRVQITAAFREVQSARREAESERRFAGEMKRKAEDFEQRVSQLQQQRKGSREDFEQQHRILSRLSKRSNVSAQEQLEEARSKGSSSGELSRRILNDPSKISGQESKFAHHLLVFENSKIHVTREAAAETPPEQIKEQRQEESVLSKQQLENRTPQSSHRQINTTHFDRPSNQNSRRDRQSQQNISQSRGTHRESRQSNHSLTSIRQAEEVQEASLPPAQPSSVSSIQKQAEVEVRPKEYLPQQSSKKTISNANESKQNINYANQSRPSISKANQSRQSISNANESKQNISNANQSRQSIIPEQPQSQKQTFYRNTQQTNVPIYVARPSPLQPQEKRESSQSQSGSKAKVRISYGQPSDKSIQIKRRDMGGSQVSMQSNKLPHEGSFNQVSPIPIRDSNIHQRHPTPPSLFSSQRRQNFQSRQSTINEPQEPTESIINGINQVASRLSTYGNPRFSIAAEPPKQEAIIRRESSPIFVAPRIDNAHSPRHSNVITFNPTRTQPLKQEPAMKMEQQKRKEELSVPPSKIVMRSVIGGKRNSLLNDTATFGKNSQRGPLNETFTQSNDSGIDVLQMQWMGPCCKNT